MRKKRETAVDKTPLTPTEEVRLFFDKWAQQKKSEYERKNKSRRA